jgi:hypothetical protein
MMIMCLRLAKYGIKPNSSQMLIYFIFHIKFIMRPIHTVKGTNKISNKVLNFELFRVYPPHLSSSPCPQRQNRRRNLCGGVRVYEWCAHSNQKKIINAFGASVAVCIMVYWFRVWYIRAAVNVI